MLDYFRDLLIQLQNIQPYEQFFLFLLGITQILDIAVTTKILKRGGSELNWIVAFLMAISPRGWSIFKYYVAMGSGVAFSLTGNGNFIPVIIFVMVIVLLWNLKQLEKMK